MAMTSVTADSFSGLATMALERMAFVITSPCEATPGEVLVECVAHARIDLQGPEPHALCVSASPAMVKEIASGMMGTEPEDIDVDDHARATVTELANILGGELVMLLTGGDSQMSLGLPAEISDEAAGQFLDSTTDGGFQCALASDSGRLLFAVLRL
jgi:hypothetical protein